MYYAKFIAIFTCILILNTNTTFARDNYPWETICQRINKIIEFELKNKLKTISNTPYLLTYRKINLTQIETNIDRTFYDITIGQIDHGEEKAIIFFYANNKSDTHWTKFISSTSHNINIPAKLPENINLPATMQVNTGKSYNLKIGIICEDKILLQYLLKWLNKLDLSLERIFRENYLE